MIGARAQVEEVRQLLKEHNAHATFFVCSKYLEGVERQAAALVADGHEFGNHMVEDLAFVYPKMPPAEFKAELQKCTRAIEALPGGPRVKWFRAPQGYLTKPMADALREEHLSHALGDAYCDDWALPHNVPYIARTLLRQVMHGSIVIVHMPEKGFREHTYRVLERVLDGLKERNLRCVTLSEAQEMQRRRAEGSAAAGASGACAPDFVDVSDGDGSSGGSWLGGRSMWL